MTSSTSTSDLTNPPGFFSVWSSSLPIVINSIKAHPLLMGLIVVSSIVHLLLPMAGLLASLAAMIALIFTQYTILQAVWSNITDGVPRYSITDSAVQWRMVLVAILVNILSFLLALLLVLPGIWFAVKSSFSIMTVCLENRAPRDAISRSHQLTKGRFWRTFWFHSLAPMLIMLAVCIVLLIVAVAIGLICGFVSKGAYSVIQAPLTIVFMIVLYLAYLTTTPPLVHLYAYLSARNQSTADADLSSVKQARQ